VQALLNDNGRAVNGSRILLIGLAYKAGTSDWRESPATIVAQRLSALGAEVRAHDAHVPDAAGLGPDVQRVDCTIEELEAADLVVVLTAHEDLPYDLIADHARLVLDTRGSLRGRSFRGQIL
jgi:UDP-N-acetyl-D-mannosaminuronate dehydrogenase